MGVIIWEWDRVIISIPTVINNKALNLAWVIKWKKVKNCSPTLNLDIINPSCLRVEIATIFFESFMDRPIIPPNMAVHSPA